MNRTRFGLILVTAGFWTGRTTVRSGAAVRIFRAADQRSGLFAPRGARLYAQFAPRILAGLHERATGDVAAFVAGRPEPVIVDLGTGPGDLALRLARRVPEARVIGVEPAATMRSLAEARGATSALPNLSLVAGDAERMPLADRSADVVVSTLSMHHWADPAAAFAEIARVLRPGGEARIFDARFAAYSSPELRAFAVRAGLDPAAVARTVLRGRFVRPYVLVTLRPSALAAAPAAAA